MFFFFRTITNSRKDISGFPIYGLSHFRAAPYFVGLIAGYILSVYKPSNYRNVISMKYSIISFITIMALCLGVLVMGPAYRFREYNALESAVFAATNRSVWAALNAAFILLCEYGTLPLIPDFLGWSVFTPLSKLSFGIYMCHFIFVMRLTLALRSQAWHDFYKVFQDSCGIVVVSSIASLYMTLFIESPLNNLVGLVIKTKPTTSKNVEKCDTKIVKSDSFKENAAVVAINDESQKDNRNIKANGIDNNAYAKEANEENKKKDVWIWDSNQLPVGQLMGSKHHLGNYDQCISDLIGNSSPPFRTKYCLADIVLHSNKGLKFKAQDIDPYGLTEKQINMKTEWNQRFNVIIWGVCVPQKCRKDSVKKILQTLLGQSYLGKLKLQPEINIENCEIAGEAKNHIDGFSIIILIWWYIAAQVTIIFILPRFGCGPLCAKFMDYEQGACIKTWWLGLLMMANYVDRTNICHAPSWYIFSDFHLTFLATIIFWIHQKQPRLGKICFGILAFLSILLPGILAYNTPELGDNPFHFQ
ncbi:hypothetical protein RR48_02758 [Papilio machaon]|uniref:Nose resistant-to-fluoxetine protein N-terminal domain-containing protein n=1 Tax=Papilio machaon TaxID=76193 RepID=A0A0N1PH40_PAPMA|nr:hypothetical protein RR48_02758 [Papilio machaon]